MLTAVLALTLLAKPTETLVVLDVGETKEVLVADVSRIAIGKPGVVDVKPLDGARGVSLTGVAKGESGVSVYVKKDVAMSLKIVVGVEPPRPAEKSRYQPKFGAVAIDTPDCTGARETAEVKKLYDEAGALVQKRGHAKAQPLLVKALQQQPSAARVVMRLAAVRARLAMEDRDTALLQQAGAGYEAYYLSCPDTPDAPKVRMILEQASP